MFSKRLGLAIVLILMGHVELASAQSLPDNESSEEIVIAAAQLTVLNSVRVSAKSAGTVESLNVIEGEQISVGDIIAKLDRELATYELAAARHELKIAELEASNDVDLQFSIVSAEVNEKVLQRSRDAESQFSKAVTMTELEKLNLELQRALLGRKQAEQRLESSQITRNLQQERLKIAYERLENRLIQSPMDGVVVEKFVRTGEWVDAGQPVVRIINLDRLRVKCLCPAIRVDPGNIQTEAVFETVIGGRKHTVPAKISFVSPELDPVEQDFAVWAEIENVSATLRPGMVGQLRVSKRESKN
jgi:multidrug efflux pump subunit AcrA (membrane-fusion protein)